MYHPMTRESPLFTTISKVGLFFTITHKIVGRWATTSCCLSDDYSFFVFQNIKYCKQKTVELAPVNNFSETEELISTSGEVEVFENLSLAARISDD